MLLPHDYLNHWLTGRYCMERSDASGTGVLNTATQAWDANRMRTIDVRLPECFPELIGPDEVRAVEKRGKEGRGGASAPPGQQQQGQLRARHSGSLWRVRAELSSLLRAHQAVGTLRPEVARELGLPEGCVVSAGGGDNAMAALGVGAVAPGTLVLSLGTSGTLFGPSAAPVVDPAGVVCLFCDATGGWLPLLCTLNCTGVTEEVRVAFGLSHEGITELAAREQPGCREVSFLPYLSGERTPNWPQSTGAILGLRPGLLRPGLLFRAAMEGAMFSLLAGLHRLRGFGLGAEELRVVGGGSANRLWRRVVADAFQLPLRFPVEKEAAALGAALQVGGPALLNSLILHAALHDALPPLTCPAA